MSRPILYLGLDVHKESVTIAVLPADAPAPIRLERLPYDLKKLHRFFSRLADRGELPCLRARPAYNSAGDAGRDGITRSRCPNAGWLAPVGSAPPSPNRSRTSSAHWCTRHDRRS
jgi:hypothetical protein